MPNGGSSPRGRGTLGMSRPDRAAFRFIPAWAGNTMFSSGVASVTTVHPRVGGEHGSYLTMRTISYGSSPRGRGTRFVEQHNRSMVRFIPAWAGNTRQGGHTPAYPPVHPRVGGEHGPGPGDDRVCVGSSPRGRGTRHDGDEPARRCRFIPAWAGNTCPYCCRVPRTSVHPRVGGEHLVPDRSTPHRSGSSPRGRGTRHGKRVFRRQRRFIPAWAGNTRRREPHAAGVPVHPRVGGEHGCGQPRARSSGGSSPRGRGTPCSARPSRWCERFIPVWAGNTPLIEVAALLYAVHPRVGGEHLIRYSMVVGLGGSSPRGRGTLRDEHGRVAKNRFIPAWAGNTGCLPPTACP